MALIAILDSNTDFLIADVWTFALKNGITLHYTNADIPLTYAAVTYVQNDIHCDGGKVSWTTGLDVAQDEITMYPNQGSSPSMVGNLTFSEAMIGGLFDRCLVTRSRFFMTTWGDTTPGPVILFVGEVTDTKLTQNTATLQSKDLRNLLNIYMPARTYQPTCPWVFGDSNCTFDRTTIAVNSTVTSVSGSNIGCSLSQAAGFFNNGTLKFTSGVNAGVNRSVKSWIPGIAQIVAPFPATPLPGDAFTITPGCTKNFAGQQNQFAGSILNGSTQSQIVLNLPNADGYFNGGTVQFTSGLNVGQIRTITTWQGGVAYMASSFVSNPALGDEVEITQISTDTTNSCTGHSNTAFFGGARFLPVPETSY